MKLLGHSVGFILCILAMTAAANAAITIDTTNTRDWKISNGVISLDWDSQSGHVFGIHLTGYEENLIDVTNTFDGGEPKGFYMDNAGTFRSGEQTSSYYKAGDEYIDWWIRTASNSTNPFTYAEHFILFAGDPGIHVYFVVDHSASDIAGSIGQIQFVYRPNLNLFTTTYSVNSGLNNLGATQVPIPDAVLLGNNDPGRQVQDATLDLHGLILPTGYRREFYTKYDYSTQEYLHKAQGVYGPNLGAWVVVPSRESLTGGPTKQDLIFTGNLLIMEAYSNHLDNQISFNVPAGTVMHRLYGPYYFHFNALSTDNPTPASLYQEALAASAKFKPFYDFETVLLQNGYVPSTRRGLVNVHITGTDSIQPLKSWVVLGDNSTDFQYSHAGAQYWANLNPAGDASIDRVIPGTYRVSAYVLGEWGELRRDNVTIGAGGPAVLNHQFTPENFSADPPVWAIGIPDRSAHEFLHGTITNPADLDPNYQDLYTGQLGESAQDDREYWGNWNYWADFAANHGAVVYYATTVGSNPATNDLHQWNYAQWHLFDPGLYAGIYNPSDDTTDGYKYICPMYVGDCATTPVPDWQIHFTTTAAQQSQGQFVVLSVGLAATESSLVATLNGNPLIWPGFRHKNADAMVRSGFSGTYQWVVFQWNTSQLNPPGEDNVIALHVNHNQGVMYDALRMEITGQPASHESTGWNDYEYVNSSTYEAANDSIPNQ